MKFSLVSLLTVINFELLAIGADSLRSQQNFLRNLVTACGNDVCEQGEDCNSCPGDCIGSSAQCGNGVCEAGETCLSCHEDCNGQDTDEVQGLYCCYGGEDEPDTDVPGAVSCSDPRCGGIGMCSSSNTVCCGDGTCEEGETMANCPIDDCKCGDDVCDDGENTSNCPEDCHCIINGYCDTFETTIDCPLDCHCGNGVCEFVFGETVANCDDCTCNRDGQCEQHEDALHCPEDCGLDQGSNLVYDGEMELTDELEPDENCKIDGISCDDHEDCCSEACYQDRCVG